MPIASTATRAELLTASDAMTKLNIMLRQILDGSGNVTNPGRFTGAQIDTAIDAVQAALTAVEA